MQVPAYGGFMLWKHVVQPYMQMRGASTQVIYCQSLVDCQASARSRLTSAEAAVFHINKWHGWMPGAHLKGLPVLARLLTNRPACTVPSLSWQLIVLPQLLPDAGMQSEDCTAGERQ